MTTHPSGSTRTRVVLIAVAISVACTVLGALFFTMTFVLYDEELAGIFPPALENLLLIDLVLGFAAGLAAGPVRRSQVGNLVLVIVALVSSWAVPAAVVGLIRLGERRCRVWDVTLLGIVVVGAFGFFFPNFFLKIFY